MIAHNYGRARCNCVQATWYVVFDHDEHNWILEGHSIEGMDGGQGKAVQADRDDGADESHVQEGFGWQPKEGILIDPGNNPKQV